MRVVSAGRQGSALRLPAAHYLHREISRVDTRKRCGSGGNPRKASILPCAEHRSCHRQQCEGSPMVAALFAACWRGIDYLEKIPSPPSVWCAPCPERLRAFEHAVGGKMQPQKAEADQADGKPHPQGYSLRLIHALHLTSCVRACCWRRSLLCRYDKKPSPSGAGGR